ncbi:Kinesin-like protein [Vigna angularis]|uniref:Kinesin-like protein n=1 Tax=Phaseolus angularis TaxID=3914 RepID=A0A8T0JSC2_PHAAN|nr:Kinesin-like protein [Vigna angularis]
MLSEVYTEPVHALSTLSQVKVRKRPMNKKELAKNEEDIIETYSNSITVHETKLKTSTIQVVEMKFLAQRRDLQV